MNNAMLPALVLLAVPALLVATGVEAKTPYHLSNPGMCNKTGKALDIDYTVHGDGVKVTRNDRYGTPLLPGQCATLSLEIVPYRFSGTPSFANPLPPKPHGAEGHVTFRVDRAYVKLKFSGEQKQITKEDEHRSESICLHTTTGDEHFQIEIRSC